LKKQYLNKSGAGNSDKKVKIIICR